MLLSSVRLREIHGTRLLAGAHVVRPAGEIPQSEISLTHWADPLWMSYEYVRPSAVVVTRHEWVRWIRARDQLGNELNT